MANLRIEYRQGTRRLGAATTLAVTGTATSGGSRPTVPSAQTTAAIIARFTSDAPVYVDIAPSPNPASQQAALVYPGIAAEVEVQAGHLISAVTATDISAATLATATEGYTSGKVSFTRPANQTPYTANDVVGGAITFPNMGPSGGGEVMITSASLEIDVTAIPAGMTSFNLYLYNVTPPSATADNAAFDIPSGDRTALIGKISLGTPVDEGSTLKIKTDGINQQITVPSGGTIFGYLVTVGGYTPAANSEVYVVDLHGVGL